MTTADPMIALDTALIEGVARGQRDALHQICDRYVGAVYWVCALYEPDPQLVDRHLCATFLHLWRSPLAALRARSIPEFLIAKARDRCRESQLMGSDHNATTRRLDRLDDAKLASVALIFSGQFRADDVVGILGCSQAALGESLRTVLVHPR